MSFMFFAGKMKIRVVLVYLFPVFVFFAFYFFISNVFLNHKKRDDNDKELIDMKKLSQTNYFGKDGNFSCLQFVSN